MFLTNKQTTQFNTSVTHTDYLRISRYADVAQVFGAKHSIFPQITILLPVIGLQQLQTDTNREHLYSKHSNNFMCLSIILAYNLGSKIALCSVFKVSSITLSTLSVLRQLLRNVIGKNVTAGTQKQTDK